MANTVLLVFGPCFEETRKLLLGLELNYLLTQDHQNLVTIEPRNKNTSTKIQKSFGQPKACL